MYEIGFKPGKIDVDNLKEGEIPIVLKQLECLELKLNSLLGCLSSIGNCDCIVFFTSKPSENKMMLTSHYKKGTEQEIIDAVTINAKELFASFISQLGWDWVELEVHIDELPFDSLLLKIG